MSRWTWSIFSRSFRSPQIAAVAEFCAVSRNPTVHAHISGSRIFSLSMEDLQMKSDIFGFHEDNQACCFEISPLAVSRSQEKSINVARKHGQAALETWSQSKTWEINLTVALSDVTAYICAEHILTTCFPFEKIRIMQNTLPTKIIPIIT